MYCILIYNYLFILLNPLTLLVIIIQNFSLIKYRNIKLPIWTKVNRLVIFNAAIIIIIGLCLYYRSKIDELLNSLHASQQKAKFQLLNTHDKKIKIRVTSHRIFTPFPCNKLSHLFKHLPSTGAWRTCMYGRSPHLRVDHGWEHLGIVGLYGDRLKSTVTDKSSLMPEY